MQGDRTNVVIVGGGIAGCSLAYYLARAGVRVTVLECSAVCAEASSAAAGLGSVASREGLFLRLAQESLRLLREVQDELETPFELEIRGSLALLRTEEELRKQRAFVEKQRQNGVRVEVLDRRSALELEPHANPDILGAVYTPLDATLNPYLTTLAFARGARALGATIRTGVEVTTLKLEAGRVRAAVTPVGEVTGDWLVVAAGAWSPGLTRTIGLDLPVEPSRGQIVVTEPAPLHRTTIKDTGHIYVCPTERGNYVIGSMTEKVGFNKGLTPDRLREYVREAAELVPALRQVGIARAWAGLRPLSPDNLPFLGPVDGYEGLVLATGHSRTGILMSAVTSKIVADVITTGAAGFPLEPFSATRFAGAR